MKKWIALAGILSVGLVTPAYAADSATDTYSGQGSPLGTAAQGGSPSATPPVGGTPGATPSAGDVAGASTEPGKNGAGVPAGRSEGGNPSNPGNPNSGTDTNTQRIEQPGRTLPFTGFDVALIALGGLGLIGLGLGVRRLSRPGPRTAS